MEYKLTNAAKNKVINFLFDGNLRKCPPGFSEELKKLMDKDYEKIHCVVLNRTIRDFMNICNKYHVNPGDKQVDISENQTVLVSRRWRIPPKEIIYEMEKPVKKTIQKENVDSFDSYDIWF